MVISPITIHTVTEDATNTPDVFVTSEGIGLPMDGAQCQHTFEVTNRGGRTWTLSAMTMSGAYIVIAAGMAAQVVCVGPRITGIFGGAELPIRFRSREYKVTMSAGGAGAIVHVGSELP